MLWNGEQKRLRAVWRIGLYGLMIILFVPLLTTVIILITGASFALSSPRIGSDFPTEMVYDRVLGLLYNEPLMLLISSTATLASVLLITRFSIKVIDRRSWMPVKDQFDWSWWKDLGIGCLVGFFSIGSIFTILVAFGNIKVTGFNADLRKLSFLIYFFSSLLLFICVGIYEEVVFRGYVLKNLANGFFGKWFAKESAVVLAVIISSLGFSLLHLSNPYANFLSFINILVIGFLLCLSILITRRIAFSIGFHILWNFSQGVLFGIPVSGLAPQEPLLVVEISGVSWLTGSSFGFEGSVLCLIINLVLTVMILFFLRSRNTGLQLNFEIAEYTPINPPASDT